MTASHRSWLHAGQVTAALEQELCDRFTGADREALTALDEGRWDWLLGAGLVVDPAARPLSAWLACRTLQASPADVRSATIRQVAPLLPDHAGDLFLGRRAQVTVDEVVAWLSRPRALSPGLAQLIDRLVDECLRAGDPASLHRLADALRPGGVTGLPLKLADLLADHDRVAAAVEQARREARQRTSGGLRTVAAFPAPWPALYAEELAELALTAADDDAIVALAQGAGRSLDAALGPAVARLAERTDGRVVAGTLRLVAADPGRLGATAHKALARLWKDPQRVPLRDRLTASVPAPVLEEFEASLGTGILTRIVRAAAGRGAKERS
jgi:hypothetical protein